MHSHQHHQHGAEKSACCHKHARQSSRAEKSCCAVKRASGAVANTGRGPERSGAESGDNADSDDPDGGDGDRPAGHQRFSWKVSGMDCPSCARKVENAVKNLTGIEQAKVLFATEKLVVDARRDVRDQVQYAVKQAGFTLQDIIPQTPLFPDSRRFIDEYGFLALFALLAAASWGLSLVSESGGRIAFIATTLVGLVPILKKAWRLIRSGTPFAIETLMSVAAVGALLIGAATEATVVLLLFMLGEQLESYAAHRARRGVSALMALIPEEATVVRNERRVRVPIAELLPGDIIEVAPGDRLPADAVLLTVGASFDESALTGESVPVERGRDEKVAAGCLCVDRMVQLRVVSAPGNSAIDRILQLIEQAEERRAPIERFLDRFSRYYTPAVMLLSLLVILIPPLLLAQPWQEWIYRGLTLLLIGCPCALVISTPAAVASGLAAATRQGALIKGGAALESLGGIRTVAFDKTGTLTEGKPQVTDIVPAAGVSEAALLARTAAVESGSRHPLAKAIVQRALEASAFLPVAEQRRMLAGIGVAGTVAGKRLQVSSPAGLAAGTLDADWRQRVDALENEGKTVVVVQEESRVLGLLALRDTLRSDAPLALSRLKTLNIRCVMLTGDNPRAAAAIAGELGIDFRAGLLPADKVTAIGELNRQRPTAMVGDGINDAPAMKAATIGIAMGSGTDVALETADAALTHSRLDGLAAMIRLSRATNRNIRQNVAIALGLKALFLITSIMGITGLWLAVLADSGATALVTANALRLLKKRDG
ncbi:MULTISPECIES: zinc/cadmium/mercury/lead-transporting ATPase [Brenneria]|uniref:P-type Zn(2+) transporter n=1 Tax=Brenneria nigrifluens DSM 30175 = ATCC 13028 TaxID=1121120 RepID=A0A2U1UQ77_9GAMM|nr:MULTISPECIES: zinc/cadmium/mercury/lead-transporting ATPase [Brenneria]EHD23578.1 heavy metal translocating P-type ATPase [Brenneria sp. EniD312]PWC23833.1 zinc/cadmium/mercury/lead-transporting ATPase [Brenneria nigrifluens DSM 30175 = ATCC 13028]QCR06504.1 zinc/cadmium/mercury/lead-transporting ATPase [Brenneria nigrifluens DSM 30175 = ATCC 13028]